MVWPNQSVGNVITTSQERGMCQNICAQKIIPELPKVNERLGISPGEFTLRLTTLRERREKIRKAKSLTKRAKLRRIHLKANRNENRKSAEVREGPTYQKELQLQDTDVEAINSTVIPPPIVRPIDSPVDHPLRESTEIYFDLETTSLYRTSHITQIGAVRGNERFNIYVKPKEDISEEASVITGIRMKGGEMFHHGNKVPCVPISRALDNFQEFLEKSENNILIGHNIKTFDVHVLINALHNTMKLNFNGIKGFIDSKILIRRKYPKLKSYKQVDLVESYIPNFEYDAHSALGDVLALQELSNRIGFTTEEKRKSSFTMHFTLQNHEYLKVKAMNKPSFARLVTGGYISDGIADRIAGSGLTMEHLNIVYNRNGWAGIVELFAEKLNNRVRVTKNKKVLEKLKIFFTG